MRTIALLAVALVGGVVACNDTAGPRSTTAPLSCTAAAQSGATLDLPVGGVRVLATPSAVGCVRPAVSASGADYLFVVSNASPTLDVVRQFTFDAQSDGQATAAAVSASASRDAPAATAGARPARDARPRASLGPELALRAYERRYLRPRGAYAAALAARAGRVAPASDPRAALARPSLATALVPNVGQVLPFRVPGVNNPCTSFDSVNAVVKYVGQRAIIVQDVAAPANGFTDADFATISAEFDGLTYPTDSTYFGAPSDIDLNGHVYILFTPEINKLTRPGDAAFFAGFFFAGDLFPRTGPSGEACLESNVAEIFYLLVPDPNGQFGDPRPASVVRQLTRGTVAHEFQHMINAGGRLLNGAPSFEQIWLDEGLAHFAEEVVGRAERGFGDLQRLTSAEITQVPADYDAFFVQNLLRFATWLERPDTSAGPSERTAENLSGRGAAWALVRYASEKYSDGNVRGFTRRLVAGPDTGLTNLTKRAGVPYDSILAGFMVANFADTLGVPNLSPRYSYVTWDMRDAVGTAAGGPYPLLVNPLDPGAGPSPDCVSLVPAASYLCQSRSGSAAYFRFISSGATSGLRVRLLDASDSGRAVFPEARLYVLRLR